MSNVSSSQNKNYRARTKRMNKPEHKIKPLRRKLGQKEHNYIAYCEKFYFLNAFKDKKFPTIEQAAKALNYSVSEIQFFLQNKNVQEALARRSLPWQTVSSRIEGGELTPQQVAAGITVMNFADERSISQKLAQLGIKEQEYFAWLQDPKFHEFVNTMADQTLNNVRHEAIVEFGKLVRSGDLKAIQYYFEVTGQFKDSSTQNVTVLIQRLIEAVQKHVKDPEVLAAIALELRSITGQPIIEGHVEKLEITADREFSATEQQFMQTITGVR